MEIIIIILLVLIGGFLFWEKARGRQKWTEQSEALSRAVGEKVESSIGVFGELRAQLGELAKQTRDIEDVGKTICTLQEALRVPKFRGGFGELGLEQLLADCLPPDFYRLQYRFKNGEMVDAVVRIGDSLVPVDSKFPFPLDDFQKMVTGESEDDQFPVRRQFVRVIKKHVDDVSKYIMPDENTYDFALMYIPAENIYYETVVRCPLPGEENDIYAYCLKKRVFPVSPNSFYAYLRAIALGLRGLQVEKSARDILGRLERLQSELVDFQQDYEIIGRHIASAAKKHNEAGAKLSRLGSRLELISGETGKTAGNADDKLARRDERPGSFDK